MEFPVTRCTNRLQPAGWLVFAVLLLGGAMVRHPVEYDNTASRYFLISAVVDHHELSIDRYVSQPQDVSFHNGHYYSNKAIGASLLGIAVYWPLRKLIRPSAAAPLSHGDRYWIRLVTTSLPFAVTGMVMLQLAIALGATVGNAIKTALAYGLGTLAWIHATLLSGHQLAASAAFIGFYFVFRAGHDAAVSGDQAHCVRRCLAAGVAVGLAGLADYTAAVIGVLVAAYCLSFPLPLKAKACFFAGMTLCLVPLAAYNTLCFGSPWSLSYGHQLVDEFRQGAARGVMGVSWPKADALAALLFSPSRGLLFIMPFFIFAPAGLASLWRHHRCRRKAALAAAVTVAYLVFNSGFYGWHGGWCFGPRYLVPALPFAALPLAFGCGRGFAVLGVLAFAQVAWAVTALPHCPPQILNPLAELILPLAADGYWAKTIAGADGYWATLALAGLIAMVALGGALGRWGHAVPAKRSDRQMMLGPMALALVIAAVLAWYGSSCPQAVHTLRARLLQDGAVATGSQRLLAAAAAERGRAAETAGRPCAGGLP